MRSLAPWIAVVAALVITLAGSCTRERSSWHANGQLRVVPGETNASGGREGPWLYFHAEGAIQFEEVVDGLARPRTGFYESGERVRELSEDELGAGVSRAMVLMKRRGFRLPPETERLAR